MKKKVFIKELAGDFAENKEVAKEIRNNFILPKLEKGQEAIIDFKDVDGATQSFIHAMISEPIRKYYDKGFENLLVFANANEDVKEIINIVYRYMQESLS